MQHDRAANLRQGLADGRCRTLAMIFAVTQALDGLTTAYAMGRPDLREGNPLLAPLVAGHLGAALALKAGVVTLVVLVALAELHGRRRVLFLRVFMVIGLAVVIGNVLAIARS
jgi:hypothetical protein